MFSNLRPDPRSLRARLLIGQILLLAAVCVGIGGATELALHRYLVGQLDTQLRETAHRSAELYGRPLPPPPPPWDGTRPFPQPGPGPEFLDAPGQPIGMVASVIEYGTAVNPGVLAAGGVRAEISPAAARELAGYVVQRHPGTGRLADLGRYRLIAAPTRRPGAVLVIGLAMKGVDQTLLRVAVIFAVVAAGALAVAVTVGILIIRRALAPLNRVAATAVEVANLPLDRGEVAVPVRFADQDADPRTEVGRLGLALNRMLEHIAAALSARQASESRVRQFVADASHELRTPLAAIRGYTELAQRKRGDLPEDVAHAMGRVESEAKRMTDLVEDLLLLARLDSGRPLVAEPVDLARLCADVISDAHAAGPDHRWDLEVPSAPVYVVGDDARLHQVLANLLANARIHTPPATTVTVSLEAENDSAVMRVVDDGPGIPAELQPEVFGRFVRGDTSRSGGSTGLGLAIAAAVVRAHAGTISVHSVAGHTEFRVRLPRAADVPAWSR